MFHASVLLERATKNLLRHSRWCFANSACEASLEDAVFFLFFGRERIADPMCLSPLTVRRGEGEFPLVGVHRIPCWCWVRCMVYPPPSTIISPTTAFLKISFPGPGGCVCSLEGTTQLSEKINLSPWKFEEGPFFRKSMSHMGWTLFSTEVTKEFEQRRFFGFKITNKIWMISTCVITRVHSKLTRPYNKMWPPPS